MVMIVSSPVLLLDFFSLQYTTLNVILQEIDVRLKSNSHAPNLHACIIYKRENILPVCACERKYTRELIYIRVN